MIPKWAVALLVSLSAGIAMSWGQTFAPEGLAPLFNSAAPVVALAAGVAWMASGWRTSVLWGALAGPLAMVGYYGMSAIRGFGVNPSMVLLWCVAGVLFGSVMGLAVWLIRSRDDAWAGLAAGFWPGIALGEAAHGTQRIADTTPVGYWWTLAGLGVTVLAIVLVTRVSNVLPRALGIVTSAAVATVVFMVYGMA